MSSAQLIIFIFIEREHEIERENKILVEKMTRIINSRKGIFHDELAHPKRMSTGKHLVPSARGATSQPSIKN